MPISVSSSKATYRAGSEWVPAELVEPLLTATGNTGAVSWSDGGAGGTFDVQSSTTAYYTPANKTQVVTITGTDSLGNSETTIDIMGTFPLAETLGNEGGLERVTTEQRAVGGEKYYREEYDTEFETQLDCLGRQSDEVTALQAFWRHHRKINPFYYIDLETGVEQIVRFTSGLKWKRDGGDSTSLYCNVKGYDDATLFDLEPPQVALVTPAAEATVSGAAVLLSATITDNVAVAALQFFANGVAVEELLTSAPWQVNWDTTAEPNGVYVITARGTDDSGNQSYAPARRVTVNN